MDGSYQQLLKMKSEESTSALLVRPEDKMRNIVQLYEQDRINEEEI